MEDWASTNRADSLRHDTATARPHGLRIKEDCSMSAASKFLMEHGKSKPAKQGSRPSRPTSRLLTFSGLVRSGRVQVQTPFGQFADRKLCPSMQISEFSALSVRLLLLVSMVALGMLLADRSAVVRVCCCIFYSVLPPSGMGRHLTWTLEVAHVPFSWAERAFPPTISRVRIRWMVREAYKIQHWSHFKPSGSKRPASLPSTL